MGVLVRRTMKKCARCGGNVDRGACGQSFVTFTKMEDDNVNFKLTQTRGYICDDCFIDFELFLLKSKEV